MRIDFDEKELIALKNRVNKQLEIIKSSKDLLPKIAVLMYQSVMENFRQEGTDKEKWKPLAITTIKSRKKRSNKILQDTGYLRTSIMPVVEKGEAIVGTNVKYARIHQFGGIINKKFVKIPKRPFLWLRREYKDRIVNLITLYLKK
jgi:phage virion morphogenesis protein